MLIERCWCGSREFDRRAFFNGIPCRGCAKCGTLHQEVEMTPAELAEWYRWTYHDEHQREIGAEPYRDRYRRDRATAEMRQRRWHELGWTAVPIGPVLDIGAGNNAMVDDWLGAGIEAVGVDLNPGEGYARRYTGPLRDHLFPTEGFALVTMLDVLEHMVDPLAELREVHRITRAGGTLIIDIPDFWCPTGAGAKHWLPIQHLWFWTEGQILALLKRAGFRDMRVDRPIHGKLVIMARRPVLKRVTYLMLPGMGDIYWSLVKLRALHRRDYPGCPEPSVYLWDIDGRRRSDGYVRRVPWVHFGGHIAGKADRDFEEVYYRAGRWLIPNKFGMDYLMAFNGWLRQGKSLEEAAPGLASDWRFPLHQPLEERAAEADARRVWGRYIVVYVSDHGMFRQWRDTWGVKGCADYVRAVAVRTGALPIFTGSAWDTAFGSAVAELVPGAVDIVGKTDLDQFMGILRGAVGCIGWCGGNTIQAVQLGIPTQIVWSGYFPHKDFFRNACPPDAWGKTYQAATIERVRPTVAAEAAAHLIGLQLAPAMAGQ